MISIITVNWDSYDFLWLMIESLQRYSSVPYELIVIDNSQNRLRVNEKNVYQFFMPSNIGHGKGLNQGVTKATEMFPKNPFIMFLDVDCHILCHQWETKFVRSMKQYDLIGGRGPASKPIRPACMFMKKMLAVRHDWSATEGYKGNRVTPGGFDVAIKAFHHMVSEGVPIGFMESAKNRFGTANGEEWCLDGQPLVYHHWHGSSLEIRKEDFPDIDLEEDKQKLFDRVPWRIP